jgi:CRISPR/Cas system CSM-associated protein Csm3 (group 7 of RAMP superfamily)
MSSSFASWFREVAVSDRICTARVWLEAQSAFAVGSGKSDAISDRLIARDWNNNPYIPASTLTGILRSVLEAQDGSGRWREVFGYAEKKESRAGKITLTDALIVKADGTVAEKLGDTADIIVAKTFDRQRVRLNEKTSSAEDAGLFSLSLVPRGARFVFELRLDGDSADMDAVLTGLYSPYFRLGANRSVGAGSMKVLKIERRDYVLPADYESWSVHPRRLAEQLVGGRVWQAANQEVPTLKLQLKAEAGFSVRAGFSNEEYDMLPLTEPVLVWQNGTAQLKENAEAQVVIPGSSLRGVLRHRTRFYLAGQMGIFAGASAEDLKKLDDELSYLFGSAPGVAENLHTGRLWFSDICFENAPNRQPLTHVAIDPFTGGAVEHALFTEQVLWDNTPFSAEIILAPERKHKPKNREQVFRAFEYALKDLLAGRLAIGGGASRGHGFMRGELLTDFTKWSAQ